MNRVVAGYVLRRMAATTLIDSDKPEIEPTEVRLELPPSPECVRVARLVAVDTANRAGFDYDESEDLRLAVGELCHAGLSCANQALSVWFISTADAVSVRGRTTLHPDLPPPEVDGDLSWLARQILDAVCDGYTFEHDGSDVKFWLVKRRRLP
jgi:hypothetical protein